MAVGVILDFAGGSADQHDRVIDKMDPGGRVAEHAIFHVAGPFGGGWRVVDVWGSPAAFQAFAESQIGPLAGAEGLPEPRIETFEVAEQFDERGGSNGGITHFQIVRPANMDQAAFEAADAQIRDDRKAPEHWMFHVNGGTDDGWIVADGWTSKEARDEFVATKVAPAMQAAGAPPPTIEDLPVHNTLMAR